MNILRFTESDNSLEKEKYKMKIKTGVSKIVLFYIGFTHLFLSALTTASD